MKEKEVIKERDYLYALVENKEEEDVIFVKSNSRLVKVKTSSIFFVEALKDYVVINVGDVKYTIHSTMKDIERKLAGDNFIRVHRSYIIRIDKIISIELKGIKEEIMLKHWKRST